jgi:hypothetical protein
MRRGDSAAGRIPLSGATDGLLEGRRSDRSAVEQSHVISAEEWSSHFSRKWPFWERPPRHKICATDRPAPWMVAPQTHRSSGRH